MAGAFSSVKIVSNTIVLKLEADERFLEYLKSTVKKSFSTAMILRHSVFIFSRDNERHRRKIFLTWALNLLSKELSASKLFLREALLKSCDLPINIQIASKSSVIGVKKAYAYFDADGLSIKCYGKEGPLFSYIRAMLKNRCKVDMRLYEIRLSAIDKNAVFAIKTIFSKKLFIGLESYEIVYSRSDFEKFYNNICALGSGGIDFAAAERARKLAVLGLSGILDPENIKKRYFELAKKYHPDLNQDKSEDEKAMLTQKFMQIKEAYEFLK